MNCNNDNDGDDFMGDDDDNSFNLHQIEQRDTDKLLKNISNNGYRDGYQLFNEDAKSMKMGYDIAFKYLVHMGLIVGQLRTLAYYSKPFAKDSIFLARLSDKLVKIEKINYQNIFKWKITYYEEDEQIDLEDFASKISKIEAQLNSMKQSMINFINSNNDEQMNHNLIDIPEFNHFFNEINLLDDGSSLNENEDPKMDDINNLMTHL
jgi:hypothetical protein